MATIERTITGAEKMVKRLIPGENASEAKRPTLSLTFDRIRPTKK